MRNYSVLLGIIVIAILGSACGQDECAENIDCPELWQCVSSEYGMRCLDPESAAEEEFQNSEIADTSEFDMNTFKSNHSEAESALSFADESDTQRPDNVNIEKFIGLKNGAQGLIAYELQEYLNATGAELVTDGKWGPNSLKALNNFQSENGISTSHVVTEETINIILENAWKAKNEVPQNIYERWIGIKKGSAGSAVKTLQTRLKELGFPVKRVTGKLSKSYGLRALKGFQIRVGIVADGVVGATTIKKLISGRAFNDLLEMPSERLSTSISYAQFRKIPTLSLSVEESKEVLPYINLMLKNAGAKTDIEKAMLISQTAHETGRYASMTEIRSRFSSSRQKYKGRGFIQITHDYNYRRAGDEVNFPALSHPEMVADLLYGAMAASWYWSHKNMKQFVNRENINGVIKSINPGASDVSKRASYYRKVKRALF